MIPDRISTRDRRAIVLGVAVVSLLVAGFRMLPAWMAWRAELRASATELVAELERASYAVAQLETSLDSAEVRVGRFRELGAALIIADTDSGALAILRGAVAEAARVSLVRIDAIAIRMDTATHTWTRRITASARGTSDVTGLSQILLALQAGTTMFVVPRLVVRPLDVGATEDSVELLELELDIEALALISSTEKPKP